MALATSEGEPNDTLAQATTVDERVGGAIPSTTDVDWYRVDDPRAPAQGEEDELTAVSVTLTNSSCGTNGLTVTLTDESGNIVEKERAYPGKDVLVHFGRENRHYLRLDGEDAPECAGATYEVFRYTHIARAVAASPKAHAGALNCQTASSDLRRYGNGVHRANLKIRRAHSSRKRKEFRAARARYRQGILGARRKLRRFHCTSG